MRGTPVEASLRDGLIIEMIIKEILTTLIVLISPIIAHFLIIVD